MAAKYTYCSVIPFCVFLLFYSFPSHYCHAVYNITPSQALSKAQILVSPSQIFELGFFTPNSSGNQYVGIWYSKQISPSKVVVWIANREKALAVTDSAATLIIGSNGNLNLVDGKANSVWSTDIPFPHSNNSVAVLFDNGSLVLKDSISGQVLWQSVEHPGNALLPKEKMGFNVRTGERYELTSWKTETDPSIGNFTMGLSQQRPSQAFIWNGSNPHWRSGPWNKIKFTGAPEMDPSYLSGFKLEEDVEQGSASFSMDICSNSYCHMFISSQGIAKVMQKDKETDWYFRWEAPKSSCDVYGVCGHFALCKASGSPICKCMKGFVPKSNEEWKKGNWKGGCVRRTKLLCDKSTGNSSSSPKGKKDGFWKMGMVKLPDFHEYVLIEKAESCNAWCQSNCSCLAYTFVDGIGCLVWSKDLVDIQEFSYGGEDLFLRLAHTELGELFG
ncbi:hypothetical protein FEM48_Zijuj01G0100800 [Ziziphus jujuba var. spinosa]|uniref:Uncharacterized protein n=1 Tax=Ziziphus jujuba var. spinosa TaxID=714518 RepID=A0A978W0L9_ZIZJJ|nr:hypothetical protein FEM48_Zijuj01G0100800 [Ziziphus jujuba var. spinosa]